MFYPVLGEIARNDSGFLGIPPTLKAFVNTMALDKKAMAVAQSYGGWGIFAKEVSMIVRF